MVSSDRRVTIREVATRAGVSHQTVSRYLKGDPQMREGVRESIAQAIAELDYRPNLAARMMRYRRSGRLALVLPLRRSSATPDILLGAKAAADEAGYALEALVLEGPTSASDARILEYLEAGFFEGMVSLAPLPADWLAAGRQRVPVVVTGDYDREMRSTGALADASALREMMTALAQAGHRTFVHLAGEAAHASARERRETYTRVVSDLGLTSWGVIETGWDPQRARVAVHGLPAAVTAVVAAQDVLAAGAIRGLGEVGRRVPQDVVVTGWDDHEVGRVMVPSLTTVRTDHPLVGRRAVERLLCALREEDYVPDPAPLTQVLWRESTAGAVG